MVGALGLLAATPTPAAAPPVEAFGRLPEFSTLAMSPNGRSLAWGEDGGKSTTVVMLDLESGRTLAKLPLNDKLRALRWADDETLLIEITATASPTGTLESYEFQRIFSLQVATGKICMLLMRDDARQYVTGSALLTTHTGTPRSVVMSSWDFSATSQRMQTGTRLAGKRADSGWVYSVFEVDTRTCQGKLLDQGTQFTAQWILGTDGKPVARVEWEPAQRRQTLLAKAGSGWSVILTRDQAPLDIATSSTDNRSVLAIGNLDGRSKLWAIPLDGSSPTIAAEDAELEVMDFIVDEFTGAPLGVSLGGDESRVVWTDTRVRTRSQSLSKAFDAGRVAIVGHSRDFEQVIARVSSPSTPPVYYAVDFKSGRADIVGEAYPALAKVKLASVRATSYAARDGARIPAYLTVPAGARKRICRSSCSPRWSRRSRLSAI